MDFSAAKKAMDEGQKVRRREVNGYFQMDHGFIMRIENGNGYLPSTWDIRADDWEIIKNE